MITSYHQFRYHALPSIFFKKEVYYLMVTRWKIDNEVLILQKIHSVTLLIMC